MEINSGLEPSQVVVDFQRSSINEFQKVFIGVSIKCRFFLFDRVNWRKNQEIWLVFVYRDDKKTRTVLQSFVTLAQVLELDFQVGMATLCCEISDKKEESPYCIA